MLGNEIHDNRQKFIITTSEPYKNLAIDSSANTI
jgi:hypothetical protein